MGVKTATSFEEYKTSAKSTDIYSDFNHTFLPHPNTGQITRKTNIDSVKLALRNLILTNKYERLRNPEFGGNINRFLFEPLEPRIEKEIAQEIEAMVERYEPRVQLTYVTVNAVEEDNAVYVNIEFRVVTSKDKQELDIVLYRVR